MTTARSRYRELKRQRELIRTLIEQTTQGTPRTVGRAVAGVADPGQPASPRPATRTVARVPRALAEIVPFPTIRP